MSRFCVHLLQIQCSTPYYKYSNPTELKTRALNYNKGEVNALLDLQVPTESSPEPYPEYGDNSGTM